jgi:lipid-binding SYLF domain-containing protein
MKITKAPYRSCLLAVLTAGLLVNSAAWADDKDKDQSDIDKRLDNSAKVLDEVMGVPDKAIPDKIMRDAKCIAVIPSMVKIAIGFGGSHGKGVAGARRRRSPSPAAAGVCSWAGRRSI